MIFYPEALSNKAFFLDKILEDIELVNQVVSRFVAEPFEIEPIKRIWNPGGGSTLFKIKLANRHYLLKVKHLSVWVESRLESEADFIRISSLQNEYNFLNFLSKEDYIPKVLFYDQRNSFGFLAVEWLEPFKLVVKKMDIFQLIDLHAKLKMIIEDLYFKGIVHTDIHEFNICFRDKAPVLIDFEEARFFKQELNFENSLDFCGKNQYGDVGEIPKGKTEIDGMTCFNRLTAVLKKMILKRLPEFIELCKFDDSCPYNLDIFQEPDRRVYQSVHFNNLTIKGQRSLFDTRIFIFSYFLIKYGRKTNSIHHLDIGSNIGMFCFKAIKYSFVRSSIGIEAFEKYVQLANVLSFLYDYSETKFIHAVCGEDRLSNLTEKADFVTLLSVYHHIKEKDHFLLHLRELGARYVMAEFAVQERYYLERNNINNEIQHVKRVLNFKYCYTLAHSKDYKRPIVLFTNEPISLFDRLAARFLNSRFNQIAVLLLRIVERSYLKI
jgi:predicted Ser/Thr protein kinase